MRSALQIPASSCQSATKYGLSARTVVLCTEDMAVFEQLEQDYIDSFEPCTVFELHLIQHLAVATAITDQSTLDHEARGDRENGDCHGDYRLGLNPATRVEKEVAAASNEPKPATPRNLSPNPGRMKTNPSRRPKQPNQRPVKTNPRPSPKISEKKNLASSLRPSAASQTNPQSSAPRSNYKRNTRITKRTQRRLSNSIAAGILYRPRTQMPPSCCWHPRGATNGIPLPCPLMPRNRSLAIPTPRRKHSHTVTDTPYRRQCKRGRASRPSQPAPVSLNLNPEVESHTLGRIDRLINILHCGNQTKPKLALRPEKLLKIRGLQEQLRDPG